MFRFVSILLLAAYAVDVVPAAPQAVPTPTPICVGYQWGVTIEQLLSGPTSVFNQYVRTTECAGPAWVQSSTESVPPMSINPWGIKYPCEVPERTYNCGGIPVATCCGKLNTTLS